MDIQQLIHQFEIQIRIAKDNGWLEVDVNVENLQDLLNYAKDGAAWEEIKGELYG